jgi:SAM-dependent methyltransferase
VRAYASLRPDESILEIGCGTGRATVFFAEWGNPIVAIEPAEAMAELARAKLTDVEVRTVRFEDADLEPSSFGLVTCAQAYHWLDADTRERRIAALLRPRSTVAIISNVQVTPEDNLPFFVRVQDVYREHAPDLAHEGAFRHPDDLPSHPLAECDLFVDHAEIGHAWHWTLPTAEYLGLLSTASPHAALDEERRSRLLEGIEELIESEFGGNVTEYYVARAYLARRAHGSG